MWEESIGSRMWIVGSVVIVCMSIVIRFLRGNWMDIGCLRCCFVGFDFMRIRQKVNIPCRNYKLDEDAGW
jgi:hypothetical protein